MSKKNVYDHNWRKVRLAVLERDAYRCQLRCTAKCKGTANEVDHIVCVSDGGARLDPSNLTSACKSCNISKRNREVAARARGVRADQAGKGPVVDLDRDGNPAPDDGRKWRLNIDRTWQTSKLPLPAWPTKAEQVDYYGYDWPVPAEGWRPDDLPPDTRPPSDDRRRNLPDGGIKTTWQDPAPTSFPPTKTTEIRS